MEVRPLILTNTSTLSTFKSTLECRYGPGITIKIREYEKVRSKLTKQETHIRFLCTARDNDIIPIGFRLRPPVPGVRANKIMRDASKALIRSQIDYRRFRKATLLDDAIQRYEELSEYLSEETQEAIFRKVDYNCNKIRTSLNQKHTKKLMNLTKKPEEKAKKSPTTRTIVNISARTLTKIEEQLLSKGLKFATTPKETPVLDIISSVESLSLEGPEADEFRWKVRNVLEKQRKPTTNLTKPEVSAMRDLQKDKSIKILPADKGNASVIMDTTTYEEKIDDVLKKGKYRLLKSDPTSSIERKIYSTLKKYKEHIPDRLRTSLTPHYSKPPHLYGLPKIHKPDIPLRPITSSRGSPTSSLARFLLKIIRPLTGKNPSFVKNSAHFVDILRSTTVDPEDRFVSFDVESLYTNVPLEESLEIIKKTLRDDVLLHERTELPLEGIMDLLECCLRNSYFQVKDKFYAQEDGLPMGSSLSPVVANIYMEWFENEAIRTAPIKPKLWLRYVDDTFIIWKENDKALEQFLEHINRIRQPIKFTMEKERNNRLPFLDVLVQRKEQTIETSVYRKPTHTGQYLSKLSNHSAQTKSGVTKCLLNRAKTICSTQMALKEEISNIKNDLEQNGYSAKEIQKTIDRYSTNQQMEKKDPLENTTLLTIPYVKSVSEEIQRIGKKYNIHTVFTSGQTLRGVLTKTKPKITTTKECVYRVPCECGEAYIGETKRPLEVRIKEHRKHTQLGETSKSGIAEHAWNADHRINWNDAKVIHRETHWKKRKFKEAAFIFQNPGTFSHPSIELRNVWKPLLSQVKELILSTNKSTLD